MLCLCLFESSFSKQRIVCSSGSSHELGCSSFLPRVLLLGNVKISFPDSVRPSHVTLTGRANLCDMSWPITTFPRATCPTYVLYRSVEQIMRLLLSEEPFTRIGPLGCQMRNANTRRTKKVRTKNSPSIRRNPTHKLEVTMMRMRMTQNEFQTDDPILEAREDEDTIQLLQVSSLRGQQRWEPDDGDERAPSMRSLSSTPFFHDSTSFSVMSSSLGSVLPSDGLSKEKHNRLHHKKHKKRPRFPFPFPFPWTANNRSHGSHGSHGHNMTKSTPSPLSSPETSPLPFISKSKTKMSVTVTQQTWKELNVGMGPLMMD